MSDYREHCEKPIPIGQQKFAYQCENIIIEPLFGSANIRGYKPFKNGAVPYPNSEKDDIEHYDLKIQRHTGNSMEVSLTKTFKDKSQTVYTTILSFAELANRLFAGHPANVFEWEAPTNKFKDEIL